MSQFTQASVCAQFGAPHKITHDRAGRVIWSYDPATVTFKDNRVVAIGPRARKSSTGYFTR